MHVFYKYFSEHLDKLLLVCVPALWAWLWFYPIFWKLSPDNYNFYSAFVHVFFTDNTKEYFIGDTTDLQGTIWNFNHFASILNGSNSSFVSEIYYPTGFDWGVNEGFAWADALLAYPYVWWLGTLGFYNFHIFLTLWINGILFTQLYRKLGVPIFLALGLSCISLFQDFTQEEIFHGRPTQIHWWFHALFLYSVVQLLEKEATKRWAFFAGIALAGACLTYWFGGASVGLTCTIVCLIHLAQNIKNTDIMRKNIAHAGILSATAIGICIVCTWRLSAYYLFGISPLEGEAQLFVNTQETVWTNWHILGRDIPLTTHTAVTSWVDLQRAFGRLYIPKILWILWGISWFPLDFRKRLPWLIGSFFAIGIPMSAVLQFGSWWLPTSNAWLQVVFPPMERCGFPDRLVVAPIITMTISCAMFVQSVWKRLPTSKMLSSLPIKASFVILGIDIICGGWLMNVGIQNIPRNTPVSSLQGDRDLIEQTQRYPGAIVYVPVESSGNAFVQQLFHKQPLATGPGAEIVRPKKHIEYYANNSLLVALEMLAKEKNPLQPVYKEEDKQQLIQDGFSLIQIDLRHSASSAQEYQALLGIEGIYQPTRRVLFIPLQATNTK